jgi:hypothetical protein
MTANSEQRVPLVEDAETGHRFLVYASERGVDLELLYEGDTFWASQSQMADMFGVQVPAISKHLKNIFEEGELEEETTFSILESVGSTGQPYKTKIYNLNAVISVGYRVTSRHGTLFRIWATDKLVQILTKGFYVDKRRLKGQPDRLAELRRVIQDIRADEANMYAELRRILAMCKDYDPRSQACTLFFAAFQNRLLYAITASTAAELVISRADATKPNMGLQSWSGDYPLQDDALTGKNYLGELELRDLNRLVSMVLDFFEDQVERGWLVSLDEADEKLTEILTVNKRKMLPDGPRATTAQGDRHGKAQYKLFDEQRRDARKAAALLELNRAAEGLPKSRQGRNKTATG